MKYESFRRTWVKAFRESGLRFEEDGHETLNLHSMDRRYRTLIEFSDIHDEELQFRTGANLSWSWDALQTARTTIEEVEMLAVLLGATTRVPAEPPWLRVDVELHAIANKPGGIPLPSRTVWAKWVRETMGRLEHVEPLVPAPVIRELDNGSLRLLSLQGEPRVILTCAPDGALAVQRVEVSGWQSLDLPRETYDDETKACERLERQLRSMLARVKSALHAWAEVMDHFA